MRVRALADLLVLAPLPPDLGDDRAKDDDHRDRIEDPDRPVACVGYRQHGASMPPPPTRYSADP
jgi:hypothetical protein